MVALPEDPPVVLGASSLHGVGMYAARDLEPGDLVELAPQVPVTEEALREADVMDKYVFATKITGCPLGSICMISLGTGSLFNHAEPPNCEYHYYADTPFLRKLYAVEHIPYGSEVLFSYGDEWWTSRDIKPLPGHVKQRTLNLVCE